MPPPDQNLDFTKIALKYKSLDAFAKAARTTFAKGRMTLKSKKDLAEGQRVILSVGLPEQEKPVEIICEVLQKVEGAKAGDSNTYGVRWLNFTEKKLARLIKSEEKPEAKKAPPVAAPAPQTPKPSQPPETSPDEEKLPWEGEDEEYLIPGDAGVDHPSFEEQPQVVIPPAPEETPPPEKEAGEDREEEQRLPWEGEDEEYLIPGDAGADHPSFEDQPQVVIPPAPEQTTEKTPSPAEEADSGDEAEEEYLITGDEMGEYPSFDDRPRETEPPAPEEAAETPAPAADAETPAAESLVQEAGEQAEPSLEEAEEKIPAEASDAEIPGEKITPGPEIKLPPPPPSYQRAEPEILGIESPQKMIGLPELAEEEPTLPGPEDEAAPEEAPDEEKPHLKPISGEEIIALGSFLLKLIRLMAQPDKVFGPEGDRGLKTLYEEFQTVMSNRDEITIFVRSTGAVREFMLAGDVREPVNLKTGMPSGQFDELALKMVDFFGAKSLAGLQFRRYLTEDAFRGFVARTGRYDPSRETPEDLAAGLLREGVFHATPLHESDRVRLEKTPDFRVDMTLTRLKGDMKRLKLVAEAIGEDPAALWTLRVEDALKAIQDGELRAEVLLHADKVIEGQEEVAESDLLQEIILATPVEMLAEAAEHMGRYYEELFARSDSGPGGEELKTKLDRARQVLRQVTARLTVDLPEAAARIMGGLYRKGVFTLEELPLELREQVMLEQFIEFFLEDPKQRLEDFGKVRTNKDYKIAADRYARMVAELARRGEIDAADMIFQALVNHIKTKDSTFPERPQLAREAFVHLAKPVTLEALTNALKVAGKEKRERLAAMIYAAGPGSAGRLIELLAEVEDRSLRRMLCEILARLGEPVVPVLVERARDPASPWYLVRNLIMIMGDIKSEALRENIEGFLSHDHPRVREEALAYAAKIMGTGSEPLLVRALSEPDPLVRRKAAWVLSRFQEPGDEALVAAAKMVEARLKKEPTPEDEQAMIATAELIGKLGRRSLPDGRTMEDVLISVLESESSRGLISRLSGSRSSRTPKMRAALIEALAKTGTEKAKKVLNQLAKDKDATVKESAQAALAGIDGSK